MHKYACVCKCLHVYMCMHMYLHVQVDMHMCMHTNLDMRMHMHIYVCVSVSVFVLVCVVLYVYIRIYMESERLQYVLILYTKSAWPPDWGVVFLSFCFSLSCIVALCIYSTYKREAFLRIGGLSFFIVVFFSLTLFISLSLSLLSCSLLYLFSHSGVYLQGRAFPSRLVGLFFGSCFFLGWLDLQKRVCHPDWQPLACVQPLSVSILYTQEILPAGLVASLLRSLLVFVLF